MTTLGALPAKPGALHAQDAGFPGRSIRPLVGLAPRGATDGYTLLPGTIGPLIVNPIMEPNLPHAPLRDLDPVSTLVKACGGLVVPASRPWRTVADLVAEARRRRCEWRWRRRK